MPPALPSPAEPRRPRGATPVVLLLLAAIAAMAWRAVVPDILRARDAIPVELAARAALRCDEAARDYERRGWVASVTNVTAKMVDDYYVRMDEPPVVWPAEADLSTVDFADTNGVTVCVRLRGGPRRVSAADLARPPEPARPEASGSAE